MSTVATPERTPAPPLQKETTAGNYFVSNYPPFSFWKQDRVNELAAALECPPKPGTDLGIYLHRALGLSAWMGNAAEHRRRWGALADGRLETSQP